MSTNDDHDPSPSELLSESFDLVALFVAGIIATGVGIATQEWTVALGALFASVLAIALFRIRIRVDHTRKMTSEILDRLEVVEELIVDPSSVEKNEAARQSRWGESGSFGKS